MDRTQVRKKATQPIHIDSAFKSGDMNWFIFGLLLLFDTLIFGASYNKALPQGLVGKELIFLESLLYSLPNVLMIVKICFHQDWARLEWHSPATIALIINLLVAVALIQPLDMGYYWQKIILRFLVCVAPLVCLALTISILQRKEGATHGS